MRADQLLLLASVACGSFSAVIWANGTRNRTARYGLPTVAPERTSLPPTRVNEPTTALTSSVPEAPKRPEIVLERPRRRGQMSGKPLIDDRFNLLETEIKERVIYPQEFLDYEVVDGFTQVRPEPNYDIAIRLSEVPENTTRAIVRLSVYPGEFHRSQASKPGSVRRKENLNEYKDQINGRLGRFRTTDVYVAGTFAGRAIPPPTGLLPEDLFPEDVDPFSYSKTYSGEVDISQFLPFLKEGTELRLTMANYQMFRPVKYYDHDLLVKLITWELDEEIIEDEYE
jgi:hypothetical protein